MKTIAIIPLIVILLTNTTTAQELRFEDRLWRVSAATLIFSAVDYVGYNTMGRNPNLLTTYRVLQYLTQGVLTYWLWSSGDFKCALSFNLIWWTWGCDWTYYGMATAVNPKYPTWENRSTSAYSTTHVTWAWWTPVGLMNGANRNEVIPSNTLAVQSFVGLSISIVILL